MADSDCFTKSDVDLLIDSDLFPAIMKSGAKHICGSLLGEETYMYMWILSGPVLNISSHATSIAVGDGQHDSPNFWVVDVLSKKSTGLGDSGHNKTHFGDVANSMVKNNSMQRTSTFKLTVTSIHNVMLVILQEYNLGD